MWDAWYGKVKTEAVGTGLNHPQYSCSILIQKILRLRDLYGGCILAGGFTICFIATKMINVDVFGRLYVVQMS